ncbi:MAG: hypothetical protein ACJ74T_23585 [Pyrinomonadaceae bacterium]
MAECKAYRREIDEAADGGKLSGELSAHTSSCRACGDELRERERLRALVGGMGKVEAPSDFEFRLRARMAAAKMGGGHRRFGGARWLYSFAPVAIAACFVVVSATLYFRQAARTNTADAHAVAGTPAQNVEPGSAPSINNEQRGTAGTIDAGGQVVRVNPTDVASPKSHRSVRVVNARGMQSREVAVKSERHEGVGERTLVSSVTGAPVIIPRKTLQVILRDERGAERVVPMRSVSFGSQDFLSRGAAPKPPVVAEVGGVW